ncbi:MULTISPECIES: hypothetical protein [unclassified Streptomyces]|uniref:hypothetical protein n=1 Tax=unclassified Streptomyces TaxID=2593676 RepID=UPI00225107F8|nr:MULTISPECIES: hypothetical protein [unclassified Streptomyces]WSP54669.1 hypothetical protein OG306_09945 [Streptomyces sp. NBC_01241]WSU24654.1 hypothetical protein OG508_29395 [Streptomyces sp. NBC_01108]MCX4786225.1 hypothetical protein [Streptomyces sp. NBC_01221]MCX4797918.1 hypothetical protein [Streptomyces sp. NBC_01242]WSJ39188.1 hypothetical protein OG772_26410 [Streptomyces sp. NBC_01321]
MSFVRVLSGAARREWGPLFTTVRAGLTASWLRAVPLTLAAVCLTALLHAVQNQSWGAGAVRALGAVRAEDPLWQALLRTPLSLFVPAPDLPVWGALVQVLVVFGTAEICLGRWRTLLIAYVATLAGTLCARIGVALGPDGLFGLPASDARIVDTGPSAAVVGLAVYVCCLYRAWFTGALVIAAMVVEVIAENNLAGKEHLAAIAAVLVLCAVTVGRNRRRYARRRDQGLRPGAGTRSGAPPMRS